MQEYERLAEKTELLPIFSEHAAELDTRFGEAAELVRRAEQIAGRAAVRSIVEAEPIGPVEQLDALVIAPCTGNTLARLNAGIADGAVTMAAKSHLRNNRPIVLALASNDGLSAAARNIAELLNRKHYYFVPFGQDDPVGKPNSLIADFGKLFDTVEAALRGQQLQPILLR